MDLAVLVVFVISFPVLAAVIYVSLAKWRRAKDARRSPLNQKRFHLPGEQLRLRIEKLTDDMNDGLMLLMMSGPVMLVAYFYLKLKPHGLYWAKGDWFFPFFFVCLLLFIIRKLHRDIESRRLAKEGLAAELIVAQNLLPFMSQGCLVFNDIPAKSEGPNGREFNIDHVVIGPHAVFAIETKSRKKSTKIDESWRVAYDGKALKFPEYQDTAMQDQARSQARWLAAYLASATGEPVNVVPVVALPGWYVEYTAANISADVVVSNCKNPKFILSSRFGPAMGDAQKQRIAHAITQRYPELDV